MTRFSPEYKAFILSDEASVLQGSWKIATGHYAINKRRATKEVVLCLKQETDAETWWCWSTLMRLVNWHKVGDLIWLPILTDLLDMIEEAGWEWSRNPEMWHVWKPTPVPGTADKWANIHYPKDTEDILAAAKLAVRVL